MLDFNQVLDGLLHDFKGLGRLADLLKVIAAKKERHPVMNVGIFCGSRSGELVESGKLIQELVKLLRPEDKIVYGGGSLGVMGELATSALSAGHEVIGVIPDFLKEKELLHPGLSNVVTTETLWERKSRLVELSDCFIALPGGIGTLDEIFEVVTLNKLTSQFRPLAIWNWQNFFTPLQQQIHTCQEKGFLAPVEQEVGKLDLFFFQQPSELISFWSQHWPERLTKDGA